MKKKVILISIIALAAALICLAMCQRQNKYGGGGWLNSTIVAVGDGKFSIDDIVADNKVLIMHYYYNDVILGDDLLSNVEKYQKKGNLLYVISEEGYAVVDGKTNTCKLLVTVEKQKYDRLPNSDADKYITNLNSFDEFTKQEQKVFETMQK